ncbi:MAG: hypothetical protein Q8R28_03880 [Dehalococcoidia bacterium]|nr:hypothetical protein [Dehalococcoidia bacterium]
MRNRKLTLIIICLAIAIIVTTGCSRRFLPASGSYRLPSPSPAIPAGDTPANGLVQSDGSGAVTIDVKWLGAGEGTLTFNVDMNTHSVDLDEYDLGQLTVLRDGAGQEYYPTAWESAPGGHHRRGKLTFPLPDTLSQGAAGYLELVIRNVAGVSERVMRWEMTS